MTAVRMIPKAVFFLLIFCLLSELLWRIEAPAMERAECEEEQLPMFDELLEELPLTELEQILGKQDLVKELELDVPGLLSLIVNGEITELIRRSFSFLKQELFAELTANSLWISQVLALGLLGAVFSNYSGIFTGSQIADAGFYIIYLFCMSFLASGFLTGAQVAKALLTDLLEFMKALLPAFYLAVSFTGGGLTAASGCGWMLFSIQLSQQLFLQAVLPLAKIHMLLVMAGHLVKEDLFSRATELLEQGIRRGVKIVTGAVLGIHLLQGMVIPYADTVKNAPIRHLVAVLPGVGQGAAAASQMLLGAGVLVKNSIGTAGVLLLGIISLIPVLKLSLLALLYQGLAAVLQPVCERRMVSCIYAVSLGLRLLLTIVCSALLLFSISLAIVCAGTNTIYLSG